MLAYGEFLFGPDTDPPRSGGQINKNSDIVDWVAKLNALKEKEAALKGSMTEKEAKKEATSAAWKKGTRSVYSHTK